MAAIVHTQDQDSFGDIKVEYGNAITFKEVGQIEMKTIEAIICRRFPCGSRTSSGLS